MQGCKLKFLGCVIVVLLLLTGCDANLDVEPLWSKQDWKNTEKLINSTGGTLMEREVTFFVKPPYYNGQMPLRYTTLSKYMGGGGMMGSTNIPVIHGFDGWSNLFIYKDAQSLLTQMPAGALAVNNDHVLVAECKVVKLLSSNEHQLTGFEIAEIHYSNDGQRAIFTSTFTVDLNGFKTKERDTRGKKEREYFFIWPTGLGGL